MIATYNDERGKNLNVREDPSMAAKVVTCIKPGSAVEVEEVDRGWCKVAGGWCAASFVKVTLEDGGQDADTDEDAGALKKMSVAELKKLAKDSGIDIKSGDSKDDIIAAILGND